MFTESGIFLHPCHIDAVAPTGNRRLHYVWFQGRAEPLEFNLTDEDLDFLGTFFTD